MNITVIDAHCHIYPDKIAQKASHATGAFYTLPMTYSGTVKELSEQGEKAKIDKFIIQSVATTPKQVSSINRFIAETVKNEPDKFFGLGTLHPESENIKKDVEELISLGLGGVKLHPDIQKFKLDDYRCLKIYELCEQYKLPVLIHTGDNRYDFSNPNRLIPILEIYTDLTVIGAHFGGWSMWEEATEKLHKFKNFYVDTSSSFYALSDERVKNIISLYSTDRVMFGTDYPMWEMKPEIDRFNSLNYGKEDTEKMLYLNALRIFNIEKWK